MKHMLRSKVYINIFISYAAAILIPLAAVLIIFIGNMRQSITQEQYHADYLNATRTAALVEDELHTVVRVGNSLMNLPWVNKLKSDTDFFADVFDPLYKMEKYHEVRNVAVQNKIISEFGLSFPYKNITISQRGWYEYDNYWRILNPHKNNLNDITADFFIDGFSLKAVRLSHLDSAYAERDGIIIIQPLELMRRPRVFLSAVMRDENILSVLGESKDPRLTGVEIIFNQDILFSHAFNPHQTGNVISLYGKDIFSYKFIYSETNASRLLWALYYAALVFLCIIFSLCAAYPLTRVSYRPIAALLASVLGGEPPSLIKNNEYRLIENSFQKLLNENKIISNNLIESDRTSARSVLAAGPVGIDLQMEYANYLRFGNIEGAMRLIEELRKQTETNGPDDNFIAAEIMAGTLIQIVRGMDIKTDELEIRITDFIKVREADGLWSFITEISVQISDRSFKRKNIEYDSGAQMYRYVCDNYLNKNLSLNMMCDFFKLSPPVASRCFKTYAGVNFQDFLLGFRMEAAKSAVKNGCYKISELAEKAGYENEYSFKRAFMRHEKIRIQDYISEERFNKLKV